MQILNMQEKIGASSTMILFPPIYSSISLPLTPQNSPEICLIDLIIREDRFQITGS